MSRADTVPALPVLAPVPATDPAAWQVEAAVVVAKAIADAVTTAVTTDDPEGKPKRAPNLVLALVLVIVGLLSALGWVAYQDHAREQAAQQHAVTVKAVEDLGKGLRAQLDGITAELKRVSGENAAIKRALNAQQRRTNHLYQQVLGPKAMPAPLPFDEVGAPDARTGASGP